MGLGIGIDNRCGTELPIGRIEELAGFVLQSEGVADGAELSISFVPIDEIAELNAAYRNRPEPTDVLSFALDEPDDSFQASGQQPQPAAVGQQPPEAAGQQALPQQLPQLPQLLGDIVINPDIAQKHALIEEVTLEEELWVLVIHGILHLLGYDHEDVEEASLMEEREDDYFYQWQLRIKRLQP
jgi:probable rRNA maturation factor